MQTDISLGNATIFGVLAFVIGFSVANFLHQMIDVKQEGSESSRPVTYEGYSARHPTPYFSDENPTLTLENGNLSRLSFPDDRFSFAISYPYEDDVFIDIPSDAGRCCGSMRPTLGAMDIRIGKTPQSPAEIQEGDIISFKCTTDKFLLHRVIKIYDDENGTTRYLTQGDNNPRDDQDGFGCTPKYEDIHYRLVGVLW